MIGFIVEGIKGIGRKVMPLVISKEEIMSHPEQVYLKALKEILETGEHRPDRTGVGTISKFGLQLRYDLSQGFPAVTTKKLAWRAMSSELIWFLEGSGDEFRLREILHGERYTEKRTIWSDNVEAEYWIKKRIARHKGDLGRVYGVQWRKWRKTIVGIKSFAIQHIDQVAEVINGIKTDPYGRRHIITAWNPADLDQMALPPCHLLCQFYVSVDKKLSCHMYQRSADFPLGVPFNIASYALLTHMIAQVCDMDIGELVISFGDAHIYENQVKGVKEQLKREPLPLPKLWLNPEIKDINKFTMEDMRLENYEHHPAIDFPFAV